MGTNHSSNVTNVVHKEHFDNHAVTEGSEGVDVSSTTRGGNMDYTNTQKHAISVPVTTQVDNSKGMNTTGKLRSTYSKVSRFRAISQYGQMAGSHLKRGRSKVHKDMSKKRARTKKSMRNVTRPPNPGILPGVSRTNVEPEKPDGTVAGDDVDMAPLDVSPKSVKHDLQNGMDMTGKINSGMSYLNTIWNKLKTPKISGFPRAINKSNLMKDVKDIAKVTALSLADASTNYMRKKITGIVDDSASKKMNPLGDRPITIATPDTDQFYLEKRPYPSEAEIYENQDFDETINGYQHTIDSQELSFADHDGSRSQNTVPRKTTVGVYRDAAFRTESLREKADHTPYFLNAAQVATKNTPTRIAPATGLDSYCRRHTWPSSYSKTASFYVGSSKYVFNHGPIYHLLVGVAFAFKLTTNYSPVVFSRIRVNSSHGSGGLIAATTYPSNGTYIIPVAGPATEAEVTTLGCIFGCSTASNYGFEIDILPGKPAIYNPLTNSTADFPIHSTFGKTQRTNADPISNAWPGKLSKLLSETHVVEQMSADHDVAMVWDQFNACLLLPYLSMSVGLYMLPYFPQHVFKDDASILTGHFLACKLRDLVLDFARHPQAIGVNDESDWSPTVLSNMVKIEAAGNDFTIVG